MDGSSPRSHTFLEVVLHVPFIRTFLSVRYSRSSVGTPDAGSDRGLKPLGVVYDQSNNPQRELGVFSAQCEPEHITETRRTRKNRKP